MLERSDMKLVNQNLGNTLRDADGRNEYNLGSVTEAAEMAQQVKSQER